jgi:hypothetical protein
VTDLDLAARAYQIFASDLNLRRLGKQESFALFGRLLHDEAMPRLRGDTGLAHQLREASVYWDARQDCLRKGRRMVRVFSLQELPDSSEANLFGDLLKIEAEVTIVTTWQPQERVTTQAQLIYKKLKVRNGIELTHEAIRRGLYEVGDM